MGVSVGKLVAPAIVGMIVVTGEALGSLVEGEEISVGILVGVSAGVVVEGEAVGVSVGALLMGEAVVDEEVEGAVVLGAPEGGAEGTKLGVCEGARVGQAVWAGHSHRLDKTVKSLTDAHEKETSVF